MKRKLGSLICLVLGKHDPFLATQPRSGTHIYCTRCNLDEMAWTD